MMFNQGVILNNFLLYSALEKQISQTILELYSFS